MKMNYQKYKELLEKYLLSQYHTVEVLRTYNKDIEEKAITHMYLEIQNYYEDVKKAITENKVLFARYTSEIRG